MTMNPSDYIMGTIIFTLLTFCVVGIIVEVKNNSDPGTIDNDQLNSFNYSFNQYNTLVTSVNGLQTSVTETKVNSGILSQVNGVLNSLLNSVWGVFKGLFGSFSFMNTAFNGLCIVFGIPKEIAILFGLMVVVVISFGIYSAITRTSL